MKYYLYSSKYIFLQNKGILFELMPNKIFEIEKGNIVFIISVDASFQSFCFKAELQNIFKNPCLKTTEFPEFLMIEIKFEQVFRPKFLKGQNFKNYSICLIGEPFYILLEANNKHYFFKCVKDLKNVSFLEEKFCILMQSEQKEFDYVVIFHKNSKTFHEFIGNFTLENNSITLIRDCKTFARHGEILKYNIDDTKIELTSAETIYLNGKPARIAPFLNSIAFFQAVREKDFNLAKTYLSQNFKKHLSESHFEEFFNDFDIIKPLTYMGNRRIATFQKVSTNHSIAKVFEVISQNDLIEDIIEV